MSHDQVKQDFINNDNYQEQICKLKEKLIRYDEILAEKNELHCQLNNLKQCIECVYLKEKQVNNDLLSDLDCQSKKLKKAEETEAVLQTENKELLNQIDCKAEQICTLKQNEQKLLYEVKELKMNKKEIQNELCKAKGQIEENSCTIERLTKASKSKEEEYFDVKRQLDECRVALCRQSETYRDLEKELESTNTKLTDAKFQLTLTEEKTRLDRETMSNELEVKCQRLQAMQIEYDEARQIIDEEKSNIHKLETQVVDLLEVNEKDQCEANIHIQRLRKDNSAKDENACRIQSQISELTRKNECISSENCMFKTQLHGKNILLKNMKQAIELIERTTNNQIDQLERDKNGLECDVRQKNKKIEDLEQETCSIREKIKEIECKKCFKDTEREKCCVKKKTEKLESKYKNNNNSCCPPTKRGPKCTRDKDCKERESYNRCPSNHSKCPATTKKYHNCCVKNSSVYNDVKKMYCNLEKFLDTHLGKNC